MLTKNPDPNKNNSIPQLITKAFQDDDELDSNFLSQEESFDDGEDLKELIEKKLNKTYPNNDSVSF